MGSSLPDDVVNLLRDWIQRVERLEVLLLLEQRPDHAWTASTVASALLVTPAVAAEALDHLCRGNLLDVRVGNDNLVFRFSPGTPALAQTVRTLAHSYAAGRVEVLRVLNDGAVERMRTSTLRVFADAFLLKRRRKDG